jgi:type III restriction enzyme
LLGGDCKNLRDLAKRNFDANPVLRSRYGSWDGMQRHLQLPDHLSASLDLATGTGKSYVLYGIAAILLAEGTVDRVLVLCPSTTIEAGLLEKFRTLASDADLRSLMPAGAAITAPSIINATRSLTAGTVCVENYHAVLEHVGSSIVESLQGKGPSVAVLSDEVHHVANDSTTKTKKWKEFLASPAYGFRFLIGVSGTCYVQDEYFADVIYRYSLRQAMEEKYVKKVAYVADMPRTRDPDDKWQLIRNRHEEARRRLKARKLRPLTIIVTATIARCKDVAEELKGFLVEEVGLPADKVDEQVLVVYNNAPGVMQLYSVDRPFSSVEWIVSVSMLNEGWDVKRVFQIVPHEERAFNSKLLIAQVLGRGLRIPEGWTGEQPEVTVFNHDAWAPRIAHLVNEILDIEKRISCRVGAESAFNFDLHNIDYTLVPTSVKKPMVGEYELFAKGFIDLASDSPTEDVSIEFERATTGERYKWDTTIQHKTYTVREVATEMYRRLVEAQDPDDPDPRLRTVYTDKYPPSKLEQVVSASLGRLKVKEATEGMKQKFLQSLGTLRRKVSENVRYKPKVDRYLKLSTVERQADSVSAADLRSAKTLFYTEDTRATIVDEQAEFFDEVTEPGSGFKCIGVANRHDFKTPLNAVIADSENEKRFINMLLQPANAGCFQAWIKSVSTRFYEIDYAWKKGEHAKRSKFNPDFFIKVSDELILVAEVKGDEELNEPSEENRKKNEYATAHFKRVNANLEKEGSALRYKFNFLTEGSFNKFFQSVREGAIAHFRSDLDVALAAE